LSKKGCLLKQPGLETEIRYIADTMKRFNELFTLSGLQYLVWATIFLISFFSMLSVDGPRLSAASAIINTCMYALIVYGNIRFLYPLFYQKKRYILYILGSVLLLLIAGAAKKYLSLLIYDKFSSGAPPLLNIETYITFLLSGITVFVLSFVFRLAMAYFLLKQQSEEALHQRSQFELRLLRAQVQPHFLFNTLNNMYYEAYLESPRTALLIERLSDIMRYFVDQSIQDMVPLGTEVQFLDNYIALEKIRIKPEPVIRFEREFDPQVQVPPMLLMTFVENIFKHGIDKISGRNEVTLSLLQTDGHLLFTAKNTLNEHADPASSPGLGLTNLRKRLTILFGTDFMMETSASADHFVATLKVPIS
jgi:sensor histidine kinase YesM